MPTQPARLACVLVVVVSLFGACQPAVTASPSAAPLTAGPTVAPPTAGGTLPGPTAAPASAAASTAPAGPLTFTVQTYPVPAGAHPHDVAPASDGGVWYTGQGNATLGWLDPVTGDVREAPLGGGAAPHGVISGPDGAAWVTDQGLDAIVRVTPGDFEVKVFPMPSGARGDAVHTGVFDHDGILWFTGQRGTVGRLDPATGEIDAFDTPRGGGPYGIAVTPSNEVYFVSLAGSYLGRVDKATGAVTVIEPPTVNAGTRRVWSDSRGRLWVSYWTAGMVAVYDPADGSWREWDLPGGGNQAYSIYVDEIDAVWVSDFGQNSIVRFEPATEVFTTFESTRSNASVRQMLGRQGEAWGAESGVDRLVVIRYGSP
jgi:virginiamycin B lyase